MKRLKLILTFIICSIGTVYLTNELFFIACNGFRFVICNLFIAVGCIIYSIIVIAVLYLLLMYRKIAYLIAFIYIIAWIIFYIISNLEFIDRQYISQYLIYTFQFENKHPDYVYNWLFRNAIFSMFNLIISFFTSFLIVFLGYKFQSSYSRGL